MTILCSLSLTLQTRVCLKWRSMRQRSTWTAVAVHWHLKKQQLLEWDMPSPVRNHPFHKSPRPVKLRHSLSSQPVANSNLWLVSVPHHHHPLSTPQASGHPLREWVISQNCLLTLIWSLLSVLVMYHQPRHLLCGPQWRGWPLTQWSRSRYLLARVTCLLTLQWQASVAIAHCGHDWEECWECPPQGRREEEEEEEDQRCPCNQVFSLTNFKVMTALNAESVIICSLLQTGRQLYITTTCTCITHE